MRNEAAEGKLMVSGVNYASGQGKKCLKSDILRSKDGLSAKTESEQHTYQNTEVIGEAFPR